MLKASVLTIGTEITDGQIVNSNTQWLSQKLSNYGISVALHLSSPDDAPLIKSALKLAQTESELIFICGGLGPTSDDITRHVLSDFLSAPLEFSESSWTDVKAKLESRKVTLREGHRQQCLIPQGSTIFKNSVGVAPGFYLTKNNKHFWALPGPPFEIEALWNDWIHDQLQKSFSSKSHLQLKTWLCLGVAESDLAHQTEEFFRNHSFEKIIGYRLQIPYVEIKLWHPHKSIEAEEAIKNFTQQLGSAYVHDNSQLINNELQKKLENFSALSILDTCSSGLLLTRLTQILGPLWQKNISYQLRAPLLTLSTLPTNTLSLTSTNDGWLAHWRGALTESKFTIDSPLYKTSKWREYYLVEKLILEWLKVL
ncbi:hypothetical protein K2X05_13480 [bacterium]|nr:hypothetical protein [bacterium]